LFKAHPGIYQNEKKELIKHIRFGLFNAAEQGVIWNYQKVLGFDGCTELIKGVLEFRTKILSSH